MHRMKNSIGAPIPSLMPESRVPSPSPHNLGGLRGLGPLFTAAWSVVKNRGLTIVSTAATVWIFFSLVAALLVFWTVDIARLNAIYSNIMGVSSAILDAASVQADIDTLLSGSWLYFGWSSLLPVGLILFFLYTLTAAVASIAITDQSYFWLERGQKLSIFRGLRAALGRAVPGAVILGAYYLSVTFSVLFFMGLGGVLGFIGASAFVSDSGDIIIVLVAAAGIILGSVAGIGVAVWLYTVWSVSPYALALSTRPWSALSQSRKLTRGNRLDVLIRIILVTLLVGVILYAITFPFDVALGFIPLASGGLGVIALVLYVRVLLSALSPLVTTASLMTMYVDLGGDVDNSLTSGH